MSRILILSWDGGGNTPPAFNLGSRLVRRGHRVRLMGWSAMASRAARAGLEFADYPSVPEWPAELTFEDDLDLLDEYTMGAACLADVRSEIGAFGADVVVVDCMLRAGFDATRALGVPSVALVHLSYQKWVYVWGDHAMSTRVRDMIAHCVSAVALQPPGFDEPCAMLDGHEYVGVISHPGRRTLPRALVDSLASPGDPWVLVSLSTTSQHGQRDALSAILASAARLPVRVLLTLGGGVDRASLTVPDNVTACGHVPHELVLPHVAAFVNHAGMTSIATALDAGVPMVCIPLGRDQGSNAERVAAIGAGVALPSMAIPDGFAAALEDVLGTGRYRHAARAIASTAAPLRSGEYAAELVDAIARRTTARAVA